VSNFLRPIYERFLFWAVQSNQLTLPRSAKPETLNRADYRAPGMPWIDPKKEIEADQVAVQAGFKSRHQVIRERGYDPDIVDQQRAADVMPVQETQAQPVNEETQEDEA